MKNKALFLDRDGTLMHNVPYLQDPAGVRLFDDTVTVLQQAQSLGYRLFLFTNQSGIGRGYYTWEDAVRVNDELIRQLGLGDAVFEEICIAPEAPDEAVVYRKPSPRFIVEMVEKYDLDRQQCWMLGDRLSDAQAGVAAGVRVAVLSTSEFEDEGLAEYLREHDGRLCSSLSFFFDSCLTV